VERFLELAAGVGLQRHPFPRTKGQGSTEEIVISITSRVVF
jgi:hypothetical protein